MQRRAPPGLAETQAVCRVAERASAGWAGRNLELLLLPRGAGPGDLRPLRILRRLQLLLVPGHTPPLQEQRSNA
jgi:hypothetical protein